MTDCGREFHVTTDDGKEYVAYLKKGEISISPGFVSTNSDEKLDTASDPGTPRSSEGDVTDVSGVSGVSDLSGISSIRNSAQNATATLGKVEQEEMNVVATEALLAMQAAAENLNIRSRAANATNVAKVAVLNSSANALGSLYRATNAEKAESLNPAQNAVNAASRAANATNAEKAAALNSATNAANAASRAANLEKEAAEAEARRVEQEGRNAVAAEALRAKQAAAENLNVRSRAANAEKAVELKSAQNAANALGTASRAANAEKEAAEDEARRVEQEGRDAVAAEALRAKQAAAENLNVRSRAANAEKAAALKSAQNAANALGDASRAANAKKEESEAEARRVEKEGRNAVAAEALRSAEHTGKINTSRTTIKANAKRNANANANMMSIVPPTRKIAWNGTKYFNPLSQVPLKQVQTPTTKTKTKTNVSGATIGRTIASTSPSLPLGSGEFMIRNPLRKRNTNRAAKNAATLKAKSNTNFGPGRAGPQNVGIRVAPSNALQAAIHAANARVPSGANRNRNRNRNFRPGSAGPQNLGIRVAPSNALQAAMHAATAPLPLESIQSRVPAAATPSSRSNFGPGRGGIVNSGISVAPSNALQAAMNAATAPLPLESMNARVPAAVSRAIPSSRSNFGPGRGGIVNSGISVPQSNALQAAMNAATAPLPLESIQSRVPAAATPSSRSNFGPGRGGIVNSGISVAQSNALQAAMNAATAPLPLESMNARVPAAVSRAIPSSRSNFGPGRGGIVNSGISVPQSNALQAAMNAATAPLPLESMNARVPAAVSRAPPSSRSNFGPGRGGIVNSGISVPQSNALQAAMNAATAPLPLESMNARVPAAVSRAIPSSRSNFGPGRGGIVNSGISVAPSNALQAAMNAASAPLPLESMNARVPAAVSRAPPAPPSYTRKNFGPGRGGIVNSGISVPQSNALQAAMNAATAPLNLSEIDVKVPSTVAPPSLPAYTRKNFGPGRGGIVNSGISVPQSNALQAAMNAASAPLPLSPVYARLPSTANGKTTLKKEKVAFAPQPPRPSGPRTVNMGVNVTGTESRPRSLARGNSLGNILNAETRPRAIARGNSFGKELNGAPPTYANVVKRNVTAKTKTKQTQPLGRVTAGGLGATGLMNWTGRKIKG